MPLLIVSPARAALLDAALVIVMVKVWVVTPSCAVTTVVMVLAPVFKAMAPEELPESIVAPFTVTVAVGSAVVGITVTEVTVLATLAVYALVDAAKAGLRVPLLMVKPARPAFADGARVTATE